MNQWMVLFRKEMLEMWRNYKWVWVPLVFILFGIMQPVSAHYLPQILDQLGDMPEGTIIEIPEPTGGEVLFQTLSQFGTMGSLILVLACMGVVAAERSSGVAEMILVKPVSHFRYITAKWAGVVSLTFVSYLLGYLSAYYYTCILIETVPLGDVLAGFACYGMWLLFLVTLTVAFSAMMRSTAGVAFLALFIGAVLTILTGAIPKAMGWSPARLSEIAASVLIGEDAGNVLLPLLVTLVLLGGTLFAAVKSFERKEIGSSGS